jgi:gamma-glutamyltranspeptidase
LRYEVGRLNGSMRNALQSLGQPLESRGNIGDVNAIFRVKNRWQAVADPRWNGGAGVVVNPADANAD